MFWSNWFVFKYIYSGTRNLAVLQCFASTVSVSPRCSIVPLMVMRYLSSMIYLYIKAFP